MGFYVSQPVADQFLLIAHQWITKNPDTHNKHKQLAKPPAAYAIV